MKSIADSDFDQEVLQSAIPVMCDFGSSWCRPCAALLPILEEVATQLESKVKIVKIDVDESPAIASQYKVKSIPTLIVFKNGQITATQVGSMSKEGIIGLFGLEE